MFLFSSVAFYFGFLYCVFFSAHVCPSCILQRRHLSPPRSACPRSHRRANHRIDVTYYTVRSNKCATRERLFPFFHVFFSSGLKQVGRSGVDLVNGNKRWHRWLQMFDKTELKKQKTTTAAALESKELSVILLRGDWVLWEVKAAHQPLMVDKHSLSLLWFFLDMYYCYYFLPDDCAHDATFIPSLRCAAASGGTAQPRLVAAAPLKVFVCEMNRRAGRRDDSLTWGWYWIDFWNVAERTGWCVPRDMNNKNSIKKPLNGWHWNIICDD